MVIIQILYLQDNYRWVNLIYRFVVKCIRDRIKLRPKIESELILHGKKIQRRYN